MLFEEFKPYLKKSYQDLSKIKKEFCCKKCSSFDEEYKLCLDMRNAEISYYREVEENDLCIYFEVKRS